MPFGNRKKNTLEGLFSSVLSKFLKKYHPSGNLKFNNLGIFLSLKLRNLMWKILPISLKLNFTPNSWAWVNIGVRMERTIKLIYSLKLSLSQTQIESPTML